MELKLKYGKNQVRPGIYKKNEVAIIYQLILNMLYTCTGKSMSEARILASTNPQYDNRLFIELQVQYMKTTNSVHVVYTNCSECQNKNKHFVYITCSELAFFMY